MCIQVHVYVLVCTMCMYVHGVSVNVCGMFMPVSVHVCSVWMCAWCVCAHVCVYVECVDMSKGLCAHACVQMSVWVENLFAPTSNVLPHLHEVLSSPRYLSSPQAT